MRAVVLVEVLTALVAAVVAKSPTVVHEVRERAPHNWHKRSRVPEHATIPVRIGLTQPNLHRADEFINDVAHPESANYGKHWSADKVAETFAASKESIDATREWLADFGVTADRIQLSKSRNWLVFNATVREVEDMLDAQYHVYEHDLGHRHIACDSYSIPHHLKEHIDIITPTVHFDQKIGESRAQHHVPLPEEIHEGLRKRKDAQKGKGNNNGQGKGKGKEIMNGKMGSTTDGSNPKQGHQVLNALASLDTCDTMITPACLQALYSVPVGKTATAGNTLGVVEYTPQAFLQTDLEMFFEQFAPSLSGTTPIQKLIDGAVVQTQTMSFALNGESGLDLEYAMALIAPQKTTLYQVGDLVQGASFNNFLDALDKSYCTSGGGDDKNFDGTYPDTAAGGYNKPEDCGTVTATNVISTSYSSNEHDLTAAYEQRQCMEYMKLGLQGVSVLYSSGDFGVAGNGGQCIDEQTGAYNNGTNGIFNPSFPGTCPYITSVGATQLQKGSTVKSAETASETVIFSGGGFSNVFAMPDYQKDAVAKYYSTSAPPYGADRYNNSQAVRGYPDISANGANYLVVVDGNFSLTYGTSASCPVVASMLTLINEERLAANKSTVGFINPALYANPKVMTDITSGGNQGCGTTGFEAVEGWDPVTGLGTPKYPAMLKMFMSLP